MSAPPRSAASPALEARFGTRVAAGLSIGADSLPHDIGERLRAAREQAVARAIQVRQRAAQPMGVPRAASGLFLAGVSSRGILLGSSSAPWWQRLASLMPLVALVLGLVLIERQAQLEQVHAAAEVDTLLLADDLPPAAYTDPGFAEFLRTPSP